MHMNKNGCPFTALPSLALRSWSKHVIPRSIAVVFAPIRGCISTRIITVSAGRLHWSGEKNRSGTQGHVILRATSQLVYGS